jgi:predicted lipoprotein with Yx(FWY)xxD motif
LALCAVNVAAVMASGKATTVTTHQTKRGKDLAAANGHALYMFTADKAGASKCNGSCVSTWLPLLTGARPLAAKDSGVNAKLLGTIKRANHTLQVTYNGHPLYQFKGDRAPGSITGEGANQFRGKWYIVNTTGNSVKPTASGGTTCKSLCQGY